jgi:hypothetical protein
VPERITCKCGKHLIVPAGTTGPLGVCPVCKRELLLPGHEPPPEDPASSLDAESLQIVREVLETQGTHLPGDDRPRAPGWRNRWLTGSGALVALAGLSFWLAGTPIWFSTAGIAAVFLIIGFLSITQGGGWRGLGLPYLYCLLAWGCWVGVGIAFRPERVKVEPDYSLARAENPYLPTRVVYGGRQVAEYTDNRKHEFQARRYHRANLEVSVQRPEGWTRCELEGDSTWVRVKAEPLVVLYIDNRGQPAVTFSCGQVRFHVAADETGPRTILGPRDRAAHPLCIHGRPVGVLTGAHHLVDVSGTRTYRARTVTYGGMFPFLRPPAGGGEHFLSRGRLHTLPGKVDYFLSRAPEKIQVSRLSGMPAVPEERTELTEME